MKAKKNRPRAGASKLESANRLARKERAARLKAADELSRLEQRFENIRIATEALERFVSAFDDLMRRSGMGESGEILLRALLPAREELKKHRLNWRPLP